MNWLKKAMEHANKPKESVIAMLKKNLGGMEEGRDRSVLHASDISQPQFCPRLWALLDLHKVKQVSQPISTALAVTWAMGSKTEEMIVNFWGGQSVVGNWKCRRCGDCRSMCKKPLNGCTKNKDCMWEYQQLVIEAPEFGVVGSIDCLFDVGVDKLLITEIKTVNPDDFESIIVPKPEHRLRTNLYMKLIAESQHPYKDKFNLWESRVLYVSRAFGKKNPEHNNEILPFKEFVVKRQDEDLQIMLAKAVQYKLWKTQTLMPGGICSTATDKYAKGCNMCKDCFSGQFPADQPSLAQI